MADIIKVEHLSYVYNPGMPNAVTALDDVSFTVEEGDFVGIIAGVGLGLYIVRSIVNLHQGEVIARSVEGEYCEFSFSVATAPKALTRQPKPVSVREV